MKVLERCLEMLKCIRHDSPTQAEIKAHTGMSSSAIAQHLQLLEAHGFITSELSLDKQTKGRAPRVYLVAPAWRGKVLS